MFEAILYQIIMRFLGDYIDGLDRDNLELGVWSGEIILEKLTLKENALDFLEWPVKLVFSFIERIHIKVIKY